MTESVILGPRGDKKAIQKAIKDLRLARDNAKTEKEIAMLEKRIAMFAGKVGLIKVGAATDNEVKALKYKVEDSINATKSAFKSGVVPGAGISLLNIKTSSSLLNEALEVPFRQLKLNMGIETHRDLKKDEAINVVTGEIGNWYKVGVMDPVDVIIAQVESAISIASLLVTSSGMIVERPQHIKEEE